MQEAPSWSRFFLARGLLVAAGASGALGCAAQGSDADPDANFAGLPAETDPSSICDLSLSDAHAMGKRMCLVPLTQPAEQSPIYESVRDHGGGIVAHHGLCGSHPLAWYLDDSANPTRLIACEAACARAAGLFPLFVASIRSLTSCDEGIFTSTLCKLPEAQYRFISESSCVIPVPRPQDISAVSDIVEQNGARLVEDFDACDNEPLGWYPDDPEAPVYLNACPEACLTSAGLFPAFVSSVRSLLGCEAPPPTPTSAD